MLDQNTQSDVSHRLVKKIYLMNYECDSVNCGVSSYYEFEHKLECDKIYLAHLTHV